MGVHGWNRLLAEEGWIPHTGRNDSRPGPETSFWMDPEALQESQPLLEERLVPIPPGSKIHIDGYCLCFWIHQVAYARHCQRILNLRNNRKNTPAGKWKPWQVRHLIPCFLPLDLLTQVTQELIQVLRDDLSMELLVYWDGDERYVPPSGGSNPGEVQGKVSDAVSEESNGDRKEKDDVGDDEEEEISPPSFKHETEVFRQSQRVEEWSVFQEYCDGGRIPTGVPVSAWEKAFPMNRVFTTQIMHALWKMQTPMKFCREEADSIMARAVTGASDAFILGMDSDFCFFPESSYIPINTLVLDTTSSSLRAIVMRRDILADSLDIPESAMVELAILMGNDYLSSTESLDLPAVNNPGGQDDKTDSPSKMRLTHRNIAIRYKAFVKLLRIQGEGFQLQSHLPDIQQILLFIRRLYNLQDMSGYKVTLPPLDGDPSLIPAAIGATEDLATELKNAIMDPRKGDKSVKDAVVRYLIMIIQHQEETDGPRVVTVSHVQAFHLLAPQRPPYSDIDKEIKDPGWRPLWRDVPVVYWIERITNAIVHNVLEQQGHETSVDAIASPGEVFDPYLYHAYLKIARETQVKEEALDDAKEPELAPDASSNPGKAKLQLPVDEFHATILESVRKNRVTIIQGDTGCGKSSRIPVMLLNAPSPHPFHTQTTLFIAQPRRIAAKALVERLRSVEPDLKDQIALRMGHGVREYENDQTRAWFVTTGYLVRLLANHPERFEDVSVLIIDEVHERSVDNDILCLLCRRMMHQNEHIRLVLMSATLAADMYQKYFGVPEPPIRVGARRFPVKEVFLDDLKSNVRLSSKDARKVDELLKECLAMKCTKPPSMQYMEKVYTVVADLATIIGKPGTSVLIFVPGMNEIVAITELIESIVVPGTRFTCVPIHSDIPFEDQMLVFDSSKADEVRIVIATNAAESSLTLPEVDNVICLGLCKQIVYNQASHRQMLTPTWISKASATQRAGRTGRVRPGTVYRMYARQSYESHMDPFEPGEMLRIPLDSVILMLKEMLSEEKVSEVLCTCLEPPDVSAIDRSFESLHKAHFITKPDDRCELTNLGSFVSSLGIDLALGSLIGLGIQMGVGAEAIQMAAVLSFPKSPWVMSNPLVHPTWSFNDNTCKSYVSRCHFDANLFSEPLAIMNLIWDYEHLSQNQVTNWGKFHNIFLPRIRRLASTAVNLRKRVADFLGIAEGLLQVGRPPSQMPHGIITLLRVIQVWVFHETMIQFDQKNLQLLQKKFNQTGVSLEIQPRSDMIEQNHLQQILMKDRHPFRLQGANEIHQKGDFEYIAGRESLKENFATRLESHLISYATEKRYSFFVVSFQDSLVVFTIGESEAEKAVADTLKVHQKEDSRMILKAIANEGQSSRGIGERSCGLWVVEQSSKKGRTDAKFISWSRYGFSFYNKQSKNAGSAKKQAKKLASAKKDLQSMKISLEKLGRAGDHQCMLLNFSCRKDAIRPDEWFSYNLVSFGTAIPVNLVDMKDLLGPRVSSVTKHIAGKQKIHFPFCSSTPREFKTGKEGSCDMLLSSWNRPLFESIPESARVLSVLVSNRRRENIIKLLPAAGEMEEADEEDSDLSVYFDKSANATFRWKRFNTDTSVFIDANSVPATAVPVDNADSLYCVCANTLEVRGGGLRAEGLTLLPQGKAFLLLARFTFGLFQESNFEDDSIAQTALQWIGTQLGKTPLDGLVERIEKAVDFHESAMGIGESLECFPDIVAKLLEIFDGVDGYDSSVWDTLTSNPLIGHKMAKHQKSYQQGRSFSRQESTGSAKATRSAKPRAKEARDDANITEVSPLQPNRLGSSRTGSTPNNIIAELGMVPQNFSVISLSQSDETELRKLFEGIHDKDNVGSCEKLSEVMTEQRLGNAVQTAEMKFVSADWRFFSVAVGVGKLWFKAIFMPENVGYTEPRKSTAAWMQKRDHWTARPRTVESAMQCIPRRFRGQITKKPRLMIAPNSKQIIFDELALAVQMEAAFWLERQFGSKNRRWYNYEQKEVNEMVRHLRTASIERPAGEKKKNVTKSKKVKKSKSKEKVAPKVRT